MQETKSIEDEVDELVDERGKLEKKIVANLELLRTYECEISEIEKQIFETELMKHHVRKETKVF